MIEWTEIMETDISSQVKCKHCWALLSKKMVEICTPLTVIRENNIFFLLKSPTSNVLFPYHLSYLFFCRLLTCWRIEVYKFMQVRFLIIFLKATYYWFGQINSEVLIHYSVSVSGRSSLVCANTSHTHQRASRVLPVTATRNECL